jgi:hypothetical protein
VHKRNDEKKSEEEGDIMPPTTPMSLHESGDENLTLEPPRPATPKEMLKLVMVHIVTHEVISYPLHRQNIYVKSDCHLKLSEVFEISVQCCKMFDFIN